MCPNTDVHSLQVTEHSQQSFTVASHNTPNHQAPYWWKHLFIHRITFACRSITAIRWTITMGYESPTLPDGKHKQRQIALAVWNLLPSMTCLNIGGNFKLKNFTSHGSPVMYSIIFTLVWRSVHFGAHLYFSWWIIICSCYMHRAGKKTVPNCSAWNSKQYTNPFKIKKLILFQTFFNIANSRGNFFRFFCSII